MHACCLLSGQVFSPFGEHWLAGSHGGGGISRRPGVGSADRAVASMLTRVGGHWELRAAALLKAVYMVGYASCTPADALVISSMVPIVSVTTCSRG